MRLRVTLLSMDKVRELGGVAKEKDGSVVKYPVEIAFVGANLDGKTTRITGTVCRARLATNCGETNSSAGSTTNVFEEGGGSEIGNVVRHFEVAVRASTLSMDLRDSE